MIQKKIENLLKKQITLEKFLYPRYKDYCFSNIPATILHLFGSKQTKPILPLEIYKPVLNQKFKKIVLLLIDGLGYKQWLRYQRDYKFFSLLTRRGLVSPLTTIFPSTTATALTTINSGLTPQEHALLEWNLYFREIDMLINTLPFTSINEKGQDRLLEKNVNPKILFRGKTIYQTLKKAGPSSFVFTKREYAGSAYSKLIHKGAEIISFINSADLVVNLRKTLTEKEGPAYFYVYWDGVDSQEHNYGPHTEQYLAELSVLSYLLMEELIKKIRNKIAQEILLIITADHGQVNIFPEKTIYLNRFQKLEKSYQISPSGNKILPSGGPRDVFLHVRQEKLSEIARYLSQKLKDVAKVVKTEDLIKQGFYGTGKARSEFYERAGDLLILPYKNNTIWYKHLKGKKLELLGHHGGLSEEEMLIPFAIAKLSDLL